MTDGELHIQSAFADGDTYPNPFHALLDHGELWAAEGMNPDEIIAAAQELGGLPMGRDGTQNLASFAHEFVERSDTSLRADRLGAIDEIARVREITNKIPDLGKMTIQATQQGEQ